jgi:DNA polymerase epsilon subunit 1
VNLEYESLKTEIPQDQREKLLKQRIKLYCQKSYKATILHNVSLKKDTVCMRENDFYVQTVRDFRDRRYEFKELVKIWKGRFEQAKKEGRDTKEAIDLMALYDSLQLAHKIILNSFYGYVMRKGARWYSM